MKTVYVSELPELDGKLFESKEELKKAEEVILEKQKAKKTAAAKRKEDSDKVRDAIVNSYEVQVKVLEEKQKLAQEYLNKVSELDKQKQEAIEAKATAVKEFCKKYPDGYHDTIKLGDVEKRFDYIYNDNTSTASTLSDIIKLLLN